MNLKRKEVTTMMNIKCYKVKTPVVGHNYFNGGYGEAREWEVEHFATEAEALEALEAKKAHIHETMAWAEWWLAEYATNEAFTMEETVVRF